MYISSYTVLNLIRAVGSLTSQASSVPTSHSLTTSHSTLITPTVSVIHAIPTSHTTLKTSIKPISHTVPATSTKSTPRTTSYQVPPADTSAAAAALPIKDLGYVKQQATEHNATAQYYVYRNIRYAAPPLPPRRFEKPSPPLQESGIRNGTEYGDLNPACHQYFPPNILAGVPEIDFGTEDCLFLDVYVPDFVQDTDKLPVLVWWHGGGFTLGHKSISGSPAKLMAASPGKMIFVAANYRMGPFGWLAPPGIDITPNLGLYDVRAAMDWIQSYISKFGGDPNRVTVMGESAGAGLLEHTITAYGGSKGEYPFQQAILQSSGWIPEADTTHATRTNIYNLFRAAANCSDVACMKSAPTSVMLAANKQLQIALIKGPGTVANFCPLVDGDIVPEAPKHLLAEGKFHHNLLKKMMVTNVADEGLFFTPPTVAQSDFLGLVDGFFPGLSQANRTRLLQLYPDSTPRDSFDALFGDVVIVCNVVGLDSAFAGAYASDRIKSTGVWRYVFAVPPGMHGNDVPYTFEADPFGSTALPVNDTLATYHRKYIGSFVTAGNPGWPDVVGARNLAMYLNATGPVLADDAWARKPQQDKCDFLRTL